LHKTEDEKTRKFVVELEQLVKAHFNSESIELFKQKKGELLRSTLLENIKACLSHFNISYKEEALKRAKKVRDQLSHGQPVDDLELTYVEGEIRDLPRLLLRKALEEKGINLSPEQVRPTTA
jgi:ribosomal 50S subunit-associated protein YjgA (DUF615 family)